MEVSGTDLTEAKARVVHAFRFAVETTMRAGEVVGLSHEVIDRNTRVAILSMTKNGTGRKAPLSTAALCLLDALPETGGSVRPDQQADRRSVLAGARCGQARQSVLP